MIQVYSEEISVRFNYVTKVLFETIGKQPLRITNRIEDIDPRFAVLWYGESKPDRSAIHIYPHKLLEESIEAGSVNEDITEWNEIPVFCSTSDGDIPFDVFAASFWLLSRWEEYLPHTKDQHGRFMAKQSYLHKKGLLERPVIDEWVEELLNQIEVTWPKTVINAKKFEHNLTVDVDMPYAYRFKPVIYQLGGAIKDLVQLKISRLMERAYVVIGTRQDPFDSFDVFIKACDEYKNRLTFFFHVGERAKNDPASPVLPALRDLINKLSKTSQIGLHPSYASHSDHNKLVKELQLLASTVKSPVENSRFHYVKFDLPVSFNKLIDLGITDEHSMGYPEAPGFRAGTCTPFPFYDLKEEKESILTIHPFTLMDATYIQYLELSPTDALKHMLVIANRVKQVKGTLNTVWHNHLFSKIAGDPNWEKVLLEFMSKIHSK